jgi:hypothetical protein
MDSKRLSERARQPGHDRSFVFSEQTFDSALTTLLDPLEFEVVSKPRELLKMFAGRYGVAPEASIRHRISKRPMYFEVKKQGPMGNADERACKHHTVQFQKTLREEIGVEYHAFTTVMCDSLAELDRYTAMHPYFFEEGRFFLWKDFDLELLRKFLERYTLPLLRNG